MKITRRQLRQLIKEEIGLDENRMVDQAAEIMRDLDAREQERQEQRLGTSERPDYPESDPDMPFQVTLEEFKADNKKEIKMASAHLRPAVVKVIDRIVQRGPPGMATPLTSTAKSMVRTYFLEMAGPYIDDLAAMLLYSATMGNTEFSGSMEGTLDKIQKLGSGGPEFDELMDEIEIAMTSDSYTGEPITDTDSMKIAGKVFLEKVLGL
jgi:hypothetical protein